MGVKCVTVSLSPEVYIKLNEMARLSGWSKSKIVAKLIDSAPMPRQIIVGASENWQQTKDNDETR